MSEDIICLFMSCFQVGPFDSKLTLLWISIGDSVSPNTTSFVCTGVAVIKFSILSSITYQHYKLLLVLSNREHSVASGQLHC